MLDAVLALNGLDTRVFDTSSVATTPHDASDDYITVPDAHLLFNGEFTRVGTSDLKIEGSDGKSFFIEDYFSTDKHKHLMSPEGALLTANVVDALAGPLAPGQHAQAGAQPAAAQAVIGRVETASGSCTVVRNGVTVVLNAGDTVRKGDVVVTSSSSAVAIVFTDGSTFSLSANARMVLDEFIYTEGGSNNTATISLVQGTFNFLAGQVAKTGNMKVDTPVATMGIRGTAVKAEVSAFDGTTRFIVMDERDPATNNVTTGSFELLDKRTGQTLATVNASSVSWVVAPSGPQQVTVTPSARSPADIQADFATVQQMLTIYNNFQANPIQPSTDQPDKRGQIDQSPGNTASAGGGSGGVLTNSVNQQTNFTVTIAPGTIGNPILVGNVAPIGTGTIPDAGTGTTGGAPGGGSSTGGVTQAPQTVTIITGSGIIVGTAGADIIYGSDGNDTITALQGNDQVFAGGGSDIIIAAHGEGNDFYDGGTGFDTIRFDSTTNGVTFNLNVRNGTLGDGTAVQVSTADGVDTGHDEFVRFEKIVGSPGNDVFILHDLGTWEIDGGAGVDILRLDGALDLTAASGGPLAYNIEIIDLNQDFANRIELNAANVWEAVGQTAPNGQAVLRILGGTTDVIDLSNAYQVTGESGSHIGTWQLVRTFVDPTADNAQGDPFNDHSSDGVTFEQYQFVSNGQVLATVYIQDGITIDQVVTQTNAVNDSAAMAENEAITVDVLSNDAPGFITERTLTSVGSATVTGPDGVALGSPQVQIVDNQLSIVPGTAFDALGEGQTATITVPYTMQIDTGETLNAVATITVTGTNDAPFFSSLDGYSRTAAEDAAPVTFNLLANAADPDTIDTLSAVNIAASGVDDAGQAINVSGAVSVAGSNVTIDPAFFNSLAVGESVTVTVNYDVSDGHATTHNTATLVVTGANDAPYFSSVEGFNRTASEDDAAVTFNLLNNAADPDGDSLSVQNVATSAVNGQGGTVNVADAVSIDGNNVTIDPDFFNSLAVDQSVTITVNYDVSDGHTTTHNTATLLVTGANDAPVITAAISTGTVNAGPDTSLNPVAAGYLTADHDLSTDLGGAAGFGENSLAPNDDGSTGAVDITSVFGEDGLNFFGTHYTSIYINNNGNITFASPTGQFTPSEINGGAGNPIIAPFWADVDTRSGAGPTTPGGDSTGSNLVYYDLDAEHGVVTITWDDVGYFSQHDDKQNAFQLQLIDRGNGDFDIVFRYEDVNWTTGDASNGQGGLGGTPARAGFSAGDGLPTHYYELTGSGDQAMMLALEQMQGNTGIPGVYVFHVRNGNVSEATTTGTIEFADVDVADTHSVSTAFNATATGSNQALGVLTAEISNQTQNGTDGLVTWNYVVSPEVLNSLSPGPHIEVFDVTVSDGHGGTVTQQVTITLNGPEGGESNLAPVVDTSPIVTQVSVPADLPEGTNPDAVNAIAPAVSNDGRYVVFFSTLELPDNNDNNNDSNLHGDVFLYDRLTGTTTTLTDSAHISERPLGEFYVGFSITGDGRYVVFEGDREVVDDSGTHTEGQVYTYDRVTDQTQLLVNPITHEPYSVDGTPRISSGGLITFTTQPSFSQESGFSSQHVLVTNLNGQVLANIAASDLGIEDPHTWLEQPDISGNGRYVTFWSVPHTANMSGPSDPIGIATLYSYDRTTGDFTQIATTDAAAHSGDQWWASMSDDGRYVVFESSVALVAGDTNNVSDIYLWDRAANDGAGGIIGITLPEGAIADGASIRPSISSDGRYITFASDASNLVDGDTNGQSDTFIYDRQTDTFERVSVAHDGTQGNGDSSFASDVSGGGKIVVFSGTSSNLVPGDNNNAADVFIVDRSGGTAGVAGEDASVTVGNTVGTHGAFAFSDANLTDTHLVHVTGVAVTGVPDGFTVPEGGLGNFAASVIENSSDADPNGQIAWTFDVDNALLQGLGAGQRVVQTYTVEIDDQHGGTISQNVLVTITGRNDGPAIVTATATGEVGTGEDEASGSIAFSDVDLTDTHNVSSSFNAGASGHLTPLGVLTAALVDDTSNGTGGLVSWHYDIDPEVLSSLAPGSTQNEVFNVKVDDGHGGTVIQQVTITLNGPEIPPENVAPVANAVEASGNEDAYSIAVTLTGSDSDGSVTGFQLLSLPTDGWLYSDVSSSSPIETGDLANILSAYGGSKTLYFKPADNWNGETHFQFVAIDNDSAPSANPGTATITVNPVNDAPGANDIGVSTSADNHLIPVELSGTDADGTIAAFQLSSLPEHGTLYSEYLDAEHFTVATVEATYEANAEGHVTFYFVPDPEWPLETTFEFITYDNLGAPSEAPGHVTITAAADEVATLTVETDAGFDTDELLLPLLNSDVTDIASDHIDLRYPDGGPGVNDDLIFHITAEGLEATETAPGEFTLTAGTITGIEVSRINENGNGSHDVATLTGLNIAAEDIADAIHTYNDTDNPAEFASLFQSYSYHAIGGDGADTLRGGDHADEIDGRHGNDTLIGGGGDDIFQFSADGIYGENGYVGPGQDTILGFDQGHDRISVYQLYDNEGQRFNDFSDLDGLITKVGDDTIINLGGGDMVTLHGFTGTLSAADFIFHPDNGNILA